MKYASVPAAFSARPHGVCDVSPRLLTDCALKALFDVADQTEMPAAGSTMVQATTPPAMAMEPGTAALAGGPASWMVAPPPRGASNG